MSGLKDRLGRMKSASFAAAVPPVRTEQQDDGWSLFAARVVANSQGSFVLREKRYPLEHRHGDYMIGALADTAAALSALTTFSAGKGRKNGRSAATRRSGVGQTQPPPLDYRQLLFLDTETTGLGVGAGNLPFMVGLGFFRGEAFVVEQLLLRSPADEAALLAYLAEKLRASTVVVTYNGKSFDWPVLQNRFVLNRLSPPANILGQLDLLHPSRYLWKHTMASCSLGRVEEEQLGIARQDDLPGALAPVYYAQYLACGDRSLLRQVFWHNEQDIMTLSVLAHHFALLLSGRFKPGKGSAEQLYRTGVWLDKYGENGLAEQFLRELITRNINEVNYYLTQLALYFKRKGDLELAAELWLRQIKSAGEGGSRPRLTSLKPWIELAMYYEHHVKDIDSALLVAEEAMLIARDKLGLSRGGDKQRAELDNLRQRVERLKRKQTGILVFRL